MSTIANRIAHCVRANARVVSFGLVAAAMLGAPSSLKAQDEVLRYNGATGAFIDSSRADFIFRDPFVSDDWFTVVGHLYADPQTYSWAAVLTVPDAGQADTGMPRYAGTLILDVSPDAAGTFTLEFDPNINSTFMNDEFPSQLPMTALAPGFLTISGP